MCTSAVHYVTTTTCKSAGHLRVIAAPVSPLHLVNTSHSYGVACASSAGQHWLPCEASWHVLMCNTTQEQCLSQVQESDSACFESQVKGPERDIHSGNDGGVFNEPLSDLTKLLASLVDSRNNIMVPGFYEGVRPNTLGAALQRLNNCNEFSLAGYREALGIPKLAPAANMRSGSHCCLVWWHKADCMLTAVALAMLYARVSICEACRPVVHFAHALGFPQSLAAYMEICFCHALDSSSLCKQCYDEPSGTKLPESHATCNVAQTLASSQ